MSVQNDLSVFFLNMYNKENYVLKFFFESYVPKHIFLHNYRSFINENGLIPIENLLIEEKKKLADECMATGINRNNLADAARILHTLKFINENS